MSSLTIKSDLIPSASETRTVRGPWGVLKLQQGDYEYARAALAVALWAGLFFSFSGLGLAAFVVKSPLLALSLAFGSFIVPVVFAGMIAADCNYGAPLHSSLAKVFCRSLGIQN